MGDDKKVLEKNAEDLETIQELGELGRLTPGQYWEWRCTIEEMTSAKLAADLETTRHHLLEKDQQLALLKTKLHVESVKKKQEDKQKATDEYKRFKKELEKELGLSLEDTVIDEFTFAVKAIPGK